MRASTMAAVEYLTALDMELELSDKSQARRKANMPLSINDSIVISGLLASAQQSACILTRGTWA